MYNSFDWRYESQGTPGFVELPSDLRTPVIVLGVDGSSRPGRTQKASSYRDVGVGAEFRSSSQPKVHRESGGRSMLSLPTKRWMKARSMSTGNGVALSGVGRRDRGLDKDAFPFDAYRRVRAFEERVSGLDQQLNIMQKIINETLTKRNRLETDIQAVSDKASRHRKGQTEPDTGDSKSREHQQNFRDRGEGRKEVEHGPKILELQDQLKVIQTKIQSLSTEHAVQREHFKKVADDSPSEEWKTLASQTNKLLEQLDLMAQQVGGAILSYFEKYDEHLKTTASDHLDDLQRKLDGNMNSWNEEIQQRREFEEKLLKEYSNGISWYQREIQQLQGESLNKETALERLRVEFSNERQRLNDEHKEQLAAKIIEYSRLTEKQHRKQERLVNWHSKKADEKDEKWQQKLTSAQGEITRLLHMRVKEQVGFQKETQKAGEQIRILTSDLTQVKRELDAAEKLNGELEVLIGESKQKMTDDFQEDFQALREKVNGLDAKNKEYLEEIEQLSEAKKDLKEKSKTLKSEIRRHEQELTEYRKKAEEAPQGIQDMQKSHYTAIKQLEEELAREKTSSEEEHNRQISAEREKLARLEQLTESLRMSKHEQTEQHCKALEENTHRWQNDIDKMRLEWQKELDQLHEQIREAKSNVFLKDANIRTLEQEVQTVQQRIQNVTSELSQAKEAQQSTFRAQTELEISKQEAERNLSELRRDLKGADDEKKSLIKQVAEQEAKIQTIMRENESLERSLVDVKESEETKQRLASLVGRLDQTQKQLANCQLEIRQKDAQLEKLKVTLQQERSKREELGNTQKLDRQGQNRQIAELTTQLKAKSKQLKDVELSYNVRATEQNKLLIQKSKAIKMLETKLQEAQQGKKEVQETMKKAILKQESKLSLVFNEYQKLRKEIRVMCRIRPAAPGDGATLGYETSEGKFHSKPAGLEIISQKSQYGTTRQVEDRTKHYEFDRVFEAHETNEDVWHEVGQFVQSFVEGRQVTLFCYGQTATGKTYTMSNSEHAFDADGERILTNEGIMPRSRALIFEEVKRRREKGWSVSVRGCCYEVYVKEIRLLLPGRVVKTKSLDPTGPPWWHVRDPEYQRLETIEDFDEMFESAMESRTFAETTSNSNSSRSHFILYLEFESKAPTQRRPTKGSLYLVDLAGSEDPHKASALEDQNAGRRGSGASLHHDDTEMKKIREQRLREGISINQSLRVLRKSISKIRNPTGATGKPTLEGGDEESSTLAKLLGPCLGRESMVLMFVMINLGVDSLAETKATLESGKEIAEIKLSPKKTPPSDEDATSEARRTEAVISPPFGRKPAGGRILRGTGR